MGKGARVPFAAYASVGMVAFIGTAAIAVIVGGLTQVACLPDPDRPAGDGGNGGNDASPGQRACGDGFIDPAPDGSAEECDPGQGVKATPGCSAACRVECEGGVIDPVTKHCYFRLPPNDSELGAGSACGDMKTQGHVVTFASDNEVAFLADAGFASGFWVGLTYVGSRLGYQSESYQSGEPGWNYPSLSAACPGCYARTGSDASAYFPPLGPDGGPQPDCVYVESPTEWHHSACSGVQKRDTLCEREPPGTRATVCNGGICITVAQTNKRYLFVPSDTTADDAKTSCESLSPIGSLVRFDTQEEREQLSREIALYTSKDGATFWVGLSANNSGVYVWDDGKLDTERPPLLGIDAGTPAPNARVFISLGTNDPIDRGLGHGDDHTSLHTYVCQY